MDISFLQIIILCSQTILVGALVLFLFNLRKKWGYGLLFASIGVFQFLQVFLSSTVYFRITENIFVTPGSAIFFTVSIFTVLIIYIKDDALETRKIIYALLITNILMTAILLSFKLNFSASELYNPLNTDTHLFSNNAWLLFVGTFALVLDSILLIIIYEFISRFLSVIFLKILITMLFVVAIDTIVFNLIGFANYDHLREIFVSGFISKAFAAIIYSLLFAFYIRYLEKPKTGKNINSLKDVFHTLSYKEKYEKTKKEKQEVETAVKISESRYQTLTKISPVGIFLTDAKGKTVFVNPKWSEITGLELEDALGFGWHRALHPKDKPQLLKNWSDASKNRKASYAEYRFVQPNGDVKWVIGQAVPDYNPSGEIVGYVGTITDITELKSYENKLKILKNKAEESDNLKSAFLANMSHEIRTPMNGILGFTELLKDSNITSEEKREYIELIELSGLRMMEIINNIVDISKIESGAVELINKKTHIYVVCRDLHNFFENEAISNGLKLTLNLPQETSELFIKIDRNKTISILTNLIKNAIKYSDHGVIEFGYLILTNNSQTEVEFFVKDTGIGIPLDRQEAIFERFVQADISDKSAKQGAGLGLAIVKAYVELMSGEISLISKENEGSEFKIKIPIEIIHDDDMSKQTLPEECELKKNLKVLIAEDDLNSFLVYSVYAKNADWDIIHVTTGVEAVEIARKNPDLDLILMDIKMPLMDGYMATKLIREFLPNIIIIAQSAFAYDVTKNNLFDKYITKPIDRKTFVSVIQELIKKD